ncbi:MAG: SDR family NAD(P)-dependent oxidoreductase [Calditrichaceae bacterium]
MNDKIALVTGATSGIGKACAYALAKEGCNLIITGRRKQRLDEVSKLMPKIFNIKCLALHFDIRKHNEVKKAVAGLDSYWKNVDILINNAGLASGFSKLQEGDTDDWERMIDTNVKGLLYITREIVPGMVKRQQGDIVNIGSIAGHEVYPNGNVYCATKHAVDALTKGLRMDLVDTPLRVSTVDPGLVETEFSIVRFHGDKEKAKNVYKGMQPLVAEDIADAVIYIVTRPSHVQIGEIVILPTAQRAATMVSRE